jgi:hypothetical protein
MSEVLGVTMKSVQLTYGCAKVFETGVSWKVKVIVSHTEGYTMVFERAMLADDTK